MTVGALEIFLFVVFLILSPRRITGLGRSLGRGVRDFKLEFDRDKRTKSSPEENATKCPRGSAD